MNLVQLGRDILSLAEKVAPLVGLDDEMAIGRGVVSSVINLVNNTKGSLLETDQAKLEEALDALITQTKAHAERTKSSLGD